MRRWTLKMLGIPKMRSRSLKSSSWAHYNNIEIYIDICLLLHKDHKQSRGNGNSNGHQGQSTGPHIWRRAQHASARFLFLWHITLQHTNRVLGQLFLRIRAVPGVFKIVRSIPARRVLFNVRVSWFCERGESSSLQAEYPPKQASKG